MMVSTNAYADAPSGVIEITYDGASDGPSYGLKSTVDGSNVTSIVSNITSGANYTKSVCGGLELNTNTYDNEFYKDNTGTTLDDGVIMNMYGGYVLSLKGGNSINTGYTQQVRDYMKEGVNVGSIQINVYDGTIGKTGDSEEAIMGGGGRYCGANTIKVNISGGTINNLVYAGTNGGTVQTTAVNISGGTINSDVYGGGRKSYGKVTEGTTVTLSGGTIVGNVYAGGNEDTVEGTTKVIITGAGSEVTGQISGGGSNGASVQGNRSLVFDEAYTGDNAYDVAEFTELDIREVAILSALATSANGTIVNIADDAALTLGNVNVIDGGALEFRGGQVTITSGSILNLGGTSITLNGTTLLSEGFTVSVDSLDEASIFNVVDDSALSALADVTVTLQDGTGSTKSVAASTVAKVIPEPTTATLSLLALAGLAMRRRRM
ncbi:MAG: hypothetical protein IJN29_02200 [Akkermansia sp.]|nr:hypothetical protein [Akkermansia sp.]